MSDGTWVAFAGARRIASGPLSEVAPIVKQRFDRDRSEIVLVFEVETGRQVELDLPGVGP